MASKKDKTKPDADASSDPPLAENIPMQPIIRSDGPPVEAAPNGQTTSTDSTDNNQNHPASTSVSSDNSQVTTLTPTREEIVTHAGSALLAAPLDLEANRKDSTSDKPSAPAKTYFNMKISRLQLWLFMSIVIGIILLLLAITVIVLWMYNSSQASKAAARKVAEDGKKSEELALWKLMNSSLDHSVEPCDDFFNHTCGNFVKFLVYHGINDIREIPKKYNEQLVKRGLMAKKSMATSESVAVKNLLTLYRQCMDVKTRKDLALSPLYTAVEKVIGNQEWPIRQVKGSSENPDGSWMNVYVEYALVMGSGPLFDIKVMKHHTQPEKKIFSIESNKQFNKYEPAIVREYIRAFQGWIWHPTFDDLVNEIAILTKDLSKVDNDEGELLRDGTLSAIAKAYPMAPNFTALLRKMVISTNATIAINANTEILIDEPAYIVNVGRVLSKASPRTLKNFFGWLFLYANRMNADAAFREMSNVNIPNSNQHKRCTALLRKPFHYAWSRVYMDQLIIDTGGNREHIEKIRAKATEIAHSLQDSFGRILRSDEWLDAETRDAAIEKLNAMTLKIAYEDWIFDDHKLDEKMQMRSAPNLVDRAFLQNWHSWTRFLVTTSFKGFQEKPTFVWNHAYDATHVYIEMYMNAVVVNMGILQRPFFDLADPNSIHFGFLGSVIAHEMIHGFDLVGAALDKTGSFRNWWSQESKARFYKRAACFDEQYSNIIEPITGQKLEGNATLAENIADNSGLKQSYLAFKWQRPADTRSMMKSSEYSQHKPEQLFFYSYAMNYCNVNGPENLKTALKGKISPSKYRVNVVMQNSPHFASVFNCPTGSNMNPKHKCTFW